MNTDHSIFVVNEEPYCIWEVDLKERNNQFLNSIDGEYFEYLAKTHIENIDTENDKRAAISLRTAFHHGLETLFSLIGALIQAPDCAYAWIGKCSTGELRAVVKKINRKDNSIFTKLKINEICWQKISEVVFHCYLPGTEKNKKTANLFAQLWQKLANEYLDKNNINEYNSLKHGFRVQSGGFGIKIGLEHEYGVAPPPEEMHDLGTNKHGTTFFILETIGGEIKGNRSYRSRQISLNWRYEQVATLLQLISFSIQNISSALKAINGASPESVKFSRPKEDNDFNKPWEFRVGVTNCSLDYDIDSNFVKATKRKELDQILKEQKKKNS